MKMKKLTALICAAAAAFNIMAFPAYAKGKPSLLVLGDSIATGFRLPGYVIGDNSSAKDSFANKLSSDFDVYTNLAVDGKTTAALLKDVKDDKTLRKAAKTADYTVISIGGNDFLEPMINAYKSSSGFTSEQIQDIMNGKLSVSDAIEQSYRKAYENTVGAAKKVDIKKSEKNIKDTIEALRALNKNTNIYILTVYNPFEGVSSMGDIGDIADELLGSLNKSIKAAAKKYDNVNVIDVSTAFLGHASEYTNILTMDIHPSKKGHEVIYKRLIKSFEKTTDFKHTEPAPAPAEEKSAAPSVDREALEKALTQFAKKHGFTIPSN